VRRASHQLYDPPPLILEDPVAVRILGPSAAPELEAARPNLNDPGNLALRAFLVCRSRYAEDCLAQAVAQGVRQYVLLGAGLDTFAHRNAHPQLRVFEVDHPATQAWKQSLVEAAQLLHPATLTYAPCNFESEQLDRQLAAAGFDSEAPAFFAWLGVVPYLTLTAFRATIAYVGARPTGSGIVFDYGQPRHALPLVEQLARDRFAARVAKAGEPFQLYFTPAEAARELRDFFNLEDQGSDEFNSRYFADRRDHLRLYGQSARIVSAWV
jgi:methyltransferase (TIGR00027 family)